ncbi:STAS domain-containing protein [Aquisphaera giovannonii]|nr:STAS domain-containing protein [Aquisphaera giovannonii]
MPASVTNRPEAIDEAAPRPEFLAPASAPTPPALRPGPCFRTRLVERTIIVRLDPELHLGDGAAEEARKEMMSLLRDQGAVRILLNFGGVRYLSSEMLGVLSHSCREVLDRGGHVLACGLDPLMRDVLHLTGLVQSLEICSDEAEALGLLLH